MNDLQVPCYLSRNIHVNNLIGEGGFAKIYQGKFNHLSVAIKIQHEDNLSSKNEMLVLTTLAGHNVTSLPKFFKIDSDSSFNISYIVMELYSHSLDDIMKEEKKLSLDETRIVTLEILKALNYMHLNDLIHNDIKPNNIMVKFPGSITQNSITLIDFGSTTDRRKNLVGNQCKVQITLVYVSLWYHESGQPTFCCDIQSLLFTITYLLSGKFGWQLLGAMKEPSLYISKISFLKNFQKILNLNFDAEEKNLLTALECEAGKYIDIDYFPNYKKMNDTINSCNKMSFELESTQEEDIFATLCIKFDGCNLNSSVNKFIDLRDNIIESKNILNSGEMKVIFSVFTKSSKGFLYIGDDAFSVYKNISAKVLPKTITSSACIATGFQRVVSSINKMQYTYEKTCYIVVDDFITFEYIRSNESVLLENNGRKINFKIVLIAKVNHSYTDIINFSRICLEKDEIKEFYAYIKSIGVKML